MKVVIFVLIFALLGCSDVEFQQTEEGIKQKLNANGIQINYGAEYTQTAKVVVSLSADKDLEMYLTNDSHCASGGRWEKHLAEKNWTLSSLNKNSFVYVKFRNAQGVESDCLYDDIIHDNTPPVLNFKSKPGKFSNKKSLSIGLVAKDATSGVAQEFCRAEFENEYTSCSYNMTLENITEGPQKIYYSAVDKAGNRAEPIELNWITDFTPPTIAYRKLPQELSNLRDSEISYQGEDSVSGVIGYQCSRNGNKFSACESERVLRNMNHGRQKFRVRAVDGAGNFSSAISYDWSVDLKPPTIQFLKVPPSFTKDAFASIDFKGSDEGKAIDTFECQMNSQSWFACKASVQWNHLVEGYQNFRVRAKDLAGNYSDPLAYRWGVDLTPPNVKWEEVPGKYSNEQNSIFKMSGSDDMSGFSKFLCSIDGQEMSCNQNWVLQAVKEGTHNVIIRGLDQVGNISAPLAYNWTIDRTPPVVKINKQPKPMVAESEAEFEFEARDNQSEVKKLECKIMGQGGYQDCGSPYRISNLKEGKADFSVRATDEAGNVSDAVEVSWSIDKTPPQIHWMRRPKDQLNTSPSVVSFKITDAMSGFYKSWCGLKGQLQECQQIQEWSQQLAPGDYEFEIIAMDKVGNQSTETHGWTVHDKYDRVTQKLLISEHSFNVDILFVVDNSGSMAEEQRNMARRIDNFINKINDLNWQIAVTSTDPRSEVPDEYCESPFGIGCDMYPIEHGDGGFRKFDNGDYILSPVTKNTEAQILLGNAIQLGIGGSTSEQGIRATYRALEKSKGGGKYHKNFIREDSALAVVLISDEDETGNSARNKPKNLIDYINKNWPQKSFRFHSMINLEKFNCVSNELEYGVTYNELSRITNGIVGSVCQENYSSDLASIGEDVRNQASTVHLQCVPQDTNGNGKADITVRTSDGNLVTDFEVTGNKLTFKKPLPAGEHQIIYACLKEKAFLD